MSDLGECFSDFTRGSSVGVIFKGLFDVRLFESVVVSFGRMVTSVLLFVFFRDVLLALKSLFDGLIPANVLKNIDFIVSD